MVDLNDKVQLDRLKKASTTPSGRRIIEFLKQRLDDISFEKIDTNQSVELIGQQFKAVSETRKFVEDFINLLTPEKGD